MSFLSVINKLRNLSKALSSTSLQRRLENFSEDIMGDIQKNSPVDSGHFRSRWHKTMSKSMVTISNDSPYAKIIEFGSTPGESPWPSVGKKTVMFEGKIYSSQAPGGVLQRTLQNFIIGPKFKKHFRFDI